MYPIEEIKKKKKKKKHLSAVEFLFCIVFTVTETPWLVQ